MQPVKTPVQRYFTGLWTTSPTAERTAPKWVAVSFYLLAPYVAAEAIDSHTRPDAASSLARRARRIHDWLPSAMTASNVG